MTYAVYNPDTSEYFGFYDAKCPEGAKMKKYKEDGRDEDEVSEEMLQRLTASPVPTYSNESRITLSKFI